MKRDRALAFCAPWLSARFGFLHALAFCALWLSAAAGLLIAAVAENPGGRGSTVSRAGFRLHLSPTDSVLQCSRSCGGGQAAEGRSSPRVLLPRVRNER